jgi:hypothetical protein
LNLSKHLSHLYVNDGLLQLEWVSHKINRLILQPKQTHLRKIPVTGFDFPACDDTPIGNASCPICTKRETLDLLVFSFYGSKLKFDDKNKLCHFLTNSCLPVRRKVSISSDSGRLDSVAAAAAIAG